MLTRLSRVLVFSMGVVVLGLPGVPNRLIDLSAAHAASDPSAGMRLMLEVFVNSHPTKLIAEFRRTDDGRFFSKRSELREIGVAVAKGRDDELMSLDALSGISLRYDEPNQKLFLELSPEMQLTREYSANQSNGLMTQEQVPISREFGSVLNYNLFGTSTRGVSKSSKMYHSGSASLDHRLFSPYGVLQNTAITGSTLAKKGVLRLESSFVFAHADTMTLGTLGDSITGGVNWSRPVRFGGGQISRQFALRPDLVTAPLPSVSGSAAVPSTVDVYVDNIRVASRDVAAGPFRINNIPVPGESGTARVVVRDVTGRETVTAIPFFTSPKLLAPGEFDFSLEGGVPRYNYAIESFDYGRRWIASGTARYGLTERLTLEAHGEATPGLANGGAGFVFRAGNLGTFAGAGAASWHRNQLGGLIHGSWDNQFKGFFIGASTQRTIGRYEDLASVTARQVKAASDNDDLIASGFFVVNRSARTPKAIDRLTIGKPLPQWDASIAASFVNLERQDGEASRLISLSYSQTFAKKYNVFVSAYKDLSKRGEAGITAGLSFQLGDKIIASSSASATRESRSIGFEAVRPLGGNAHDYGWRVYTNEGANVQRGVSGAYRNPWAQLGAGIRQDSNAMGGFAEMDGAVVATPAGIYPSRRIHDAFAIVDAGAPGVEVLLDNRPIGSTNWLGKAVVPDLRSFQRSKLAISPETIPAGSHVTITEKDVIPGYRGASILRVNTVAAQDTARVVVHDEKGQPMPVGAIVTHKETGAVYGIGYGGMTYIPGIGNTNTLVVQHGDKTCEASFTRDDRRGVTGRVGPIVCKGG